MRSHHDTSPQDGLPYSLTSVILPRGPNLPPHLEAEFGIFHHLELILCLLQQLLLLLQKLLQVLLGLSKFMDVLSSIILRFN